MADADAIDPDGRRIVLDDVAWTHIVRAHPDMAGHQRAVLDTLRQPDEREPDPLPGRARYWRAAHGPSAWCFVVVDFATDPARVVTAFGRRRRPR
ncbi:MAG: hypothetical protein M0Z82_06715 [Actinomycetota bacterium]|nr:hypothetical protein [Actinomycetota bacterium]